MIEDHNIIEIDFLKPDEKIINKIYNDLYKAMDARNKQSIYRLSKIITRYHMH